MNFRKRKIYTAASYAYYSTRHLRTSLHEDDFFLTPSFNSTLPNMYELRDKIFWVLVEDRCSRTAVLALKT